MKKKSPLPKALFLIALLLLFFSACDDNSSNNTGSTVTPQPPQNYEKDLRVFCSYESKYVHTGAEITFTTEEPGSTIFLGSSSNVSATAPDSWTETDSFIFTGTGYIKVFAKIEADGETIGEVFDFTYKAVSDYPWYDDEGISKDDPSLVAWASNYAEFIRGLDRSSITDDPVTYGALDNPERACGPATGSSFDVVVLGNHGEITLTFSSGISNGSGFDFAVFENSTGTASTDSFFAELAYVEVSSDGTNFVRFDSVSRTASAVEGYGTVYVHDIYGLCGMHPNAYGTSLGTPFDLDWLKNKKSVVEGLVDLNNITHVRIIDIPGNGEEADDDGDLISDPDYAAPSKYFPCYDSFGTVIYDAFRTYGTGGFDLEAIGVIHKGQ